MTPGRGSGKVRVLLLRTDNLSRSQMAEGWARNLAADRLEAWSAALGPTPEPGAVQLMDEAGVYVRRQRSNAPDELLHLDFDYMLSGCDHARETCPLFPGDVRVTRRSFDNLSRLARAARSEEEALGHYRRDRDEIQAFLSTLSSCFEEERDA